MAMRISIVPVIGTGASSQDPRRPKYFVGGLPTTVAWGGTDYGFEPSMIIAADLDAANLAFLVAQPDAFVVPESLDATLTSGQVAGVQSYLEAINLPANWVTVDFTWRKVLRIVIGTFRFMARFAVVFAQATGSTVAVFSGGVTLSRTYSSLGSNVQNALVATVDELLLDRTGVTGSTTLRLLLVNIGQQMGTQPQSIGTMLV